MTYEGRAVTGTTEERLQELSLLLEGAESDQKEAAIAEGKAHDLSVEAGKKLSAARTVRIRAARKVMELQREISDLKRSSK